MTINELDKIIEKYNLSIRRIPDKIISRYEMRHHKKGNEIVTIKKIKFTISTTIPKNAGMYMIKEVNHNNTIVKWSQGIFTGNTIQEAIQNFLKVRG